MAPAIVVAVPTIYIHRRPLSNRSELVTQHLTYPQYNGPDTVDPNVTAEVEGIAHILAALGDPNTDRALLERQLRTRPTQAEPIRLIVDIDGLKVNRTVEIWYTNQD